MSVRQVHKEKPRLLQKASSRAVQVYGVPGEWKVIRLRLRICFNAAPKNHRQSRKQEWRYNMLFAFSSILHQSYRWWQEPRTVLDLSRSKSCTCNFLSLKRKELSLCTTRSAMSLSLKLISARSCPFVSTNFISL